MPSATHPHGSTPVSYKLLTQRVITLGILELMTHCGLNTAYPESLLAISGGKVCSDLQQTLQPGWFLESLSPSLCLSWTFQRCVQLRLTMCTRDKRLKRVGHTDTWLSGFAVLPGCGDTCLLALPWNRNIFLSDWECQFSGGCFVVLEHGHQHHLGTTVGDCTSSYWSVLPVLAYRHTGSVDCILKTHAKIQGKDTLDPLARAPDGSTSVLL